MAIKNDGYKVFVILLVCFGFIFIVKSQKICGVNFVSPSKAEEFSNFNSLSRIKANWVSLVPYAFSNKDEGWVRYDESNSWWGEKSKGIISMILKAKEEKHHIMLKPHVWVMDQGWCGEFNPKEEEAWKRWERDYGKYILFYARLAEKYKVDVLCIGTEYRLAVVERELYWKGLIKAVRKVYSGKITYAANWDNYQNIGFWDELDIIGVDAYFPLSRTKDAVKKELNTGWRKITANLKDFSEKYGRKVLFTEYGYKSIHYATWNQWEVENIRENKDVNIKAQQNGYLALFQNVWSEPWFLGGFLWKWYAKDKDSGGLNNSDYTPQNKPVEAIIKKYYTH